MINSRYVNGSISLVFPDGDMLIQKCDKETAEMIHSLILEGKDKNDILILLDPKLEEIRNEVEQIKKENDESAELVKEIILDSRFYTENNYLYRQGIPLPIPKLLARDIYNCIQNKDQDTLDKLDKFWAWTSLIRKEESRESFYNYVANNQIPITKEGFIIAYRRAHFKSTNKDKDLVSFITQEYLRLRKNKKSTTVGVYKSNNVYTLKEVDNAVKVGILKELYSELSEFEDTYFESSHSDANGNKLKYYIGKETRESEDKVDWSNAECSRGIHVGHYRYNFTGFGDTPLVVAVNPMDIVRCPYSDSSKMRVLAITPICTLENDTQFEITPEIEEIIDEMMVNHLERLKELETKDFANCGITHTLVKEIPNFQASNIFKVIKETVNSSVVKERYTKLND